MSTSPPISRELTAEQESLRKVVRDFAVNEIAPHAEAWDRDHTFPVDTVLAMGELGLFGIPFPEEYGGGGADLTTLCVALEELGRVDQSMAITVEAAVGLGANPIFRFGTEEQRQRWLPDLVAGRALGGFGLTEPDAGSDAGGTRTTAVLDESAGEWVINGEKAFITNSGSAITSLVTVTAVTGSVGGRPEISTIIVPAGTPGFTVQPPYRKMGWHASDTHGLSFADCRVPVGNLLGERGRGFANFLSVLDDGRVAIAALAVGVIEGCLAECVRYANERNAFGKPIGANQAIAFKCADMAVMADAARALTYDAARLHDAGRPFKREAAVAKLYATEAAVTATREATQVFGGYGFIDETPVSRFYRDSKILEIGEGTSEIQRLVISRELGLPIDLTGAPGGAPSGGGSAGTFLRMSDGPRRPRRRRTWPQRLLISLNVVVVLICFSSAAGLAFAFRQASDVQRFGGLSSTLDTTVEKGEPENYLLVGVDNSEGLDNKDPVLIGRSRKSLLSDTIMILRVDPTTQEAKILSLPRDLWVNVADTGSKQRINTALPGGGPERLIKTIQQNFGIPINHYVQVNFHGFQSLVDAVDGVPIYFPWPARDSDPDEANNTHTGFLVEEAGCVTLNGTEALAYARSRHFQTKTGNGGKTWVTDVSSDLGRIARQQQFIKLALKRAIAKGVRNPFVLNQLIGVAQGNVILDDAVTTKDLLDLGSQFKNFDPDSLQVYTPPTTGKTTSGGAMVLVLENAGAQPIFDLFRAKGDTDNPLRAIQVDVTNGSGKTSQAQVVLQAFDELGFTTIGSSDASSFRNSKTTVRYAPGAEAAAVEVARYIDGTPQFTLDKTLLGNSVLLVTGKDFTQLRTDPRPATDFAGFMATTTTTTIDPTSPSTTDVPTTQAGMVPETPDGEVCG